MGLVEWYRGGPAKYNSIVEEKPSTSILGFFYLRGLRVVLACVIQLFVEDTCAA